jgi:nucleoside-diphosphate-sugar epimerase
MDDNEAQIFGDGQLLRDLNYVDDVTDAFLRVAAIEETSGHFFNLGGKPYTLVEQVKMMIEVTGRGRYKLVPWPEDRKSISVGDFYGDYTKIKEFTGWEPQIDLREGLARTVAFYDKYKEHYW